MWLRFAVILALVQQQVAAAPVGVTVSQDIIAVTSDNFVGATMDWWMSNTTRSGKHWGNSGATTVNLTNANLLGLTARLSRSGLSWRLGGTPQDWVIYQARNGSWPAGSGCPAVPPFGGPSPPNATCLTYERLGQLCSFARAANVTEWLFGINAYFGRATNSSRMSFSQIETLLHNLEALKCPMTTLELGNENNFGLRHIDVIPYVEDAKRLQSLLKGSRFSFAGPDAGIPDQWFDSVVSSGVDYDEITVHNYAFGPEQCKVTSFPQTGAWGGLKAARLAAGSRRLSCGECGPCYTGGVANVTNAFGDAVWYISIMGEAARQSYWRFLRSTLIGSDYELIDQVTFQPNPDYFVALLWGDLMSSRVLDCGLSASSESGVACYAACSKRSRGGVALAFLNAGTSSVTFSLSQFASNATAVAAYRVQAVGDPATARVACVLNAAERCVPLTMNGAVPPEPAPVLLSSPSVALVPLSYAFVDVQMQWPACH